MSDTIDWRIIDRHLAGEASPSDEASLQLWLALDAGNVALLEAARSSTQQRGLADGEHWNVDAAWSRLTNRLDDTRLPAPMSLELMPTVMPPAKRRGVWRIAGAATATLVAAGLVGVLWRAPLTSEPQSAAPPIHEIVAANAQQTRVTLRDGTRVVLNAGSRLRYAESFGRTARDVELDGEAYFEVVHDESRPFRVHARGSIAEDLGTRFVVRAYAESRRVEVVVAEGSVSIRRDSAQARTTVLAAGQLGRVEVDGTIMVVNDADVDRWLSWTEGRLVLDGLTLTEAATEISRRFDVRVAVTQPELAQRRVSARFRDESLTQVMDALTRALGARWTRDGQSVVIARAE